jgi:hypothetical protein
MVVGCTFRRQTWIFRYRSPLTRKLRDMGLGTLHSVGLAEAGEKPPRSAALFRGLDPLPQQTH